MPSSRTLPNIVLRMQQHLTTFDFVLQHNDFASAKLKALQMNMDLEPMWRITVGHGIDKQSLPSIIDGSRAKYSADDLKNARLLDADCPECKSSIGIYDIHSPPESMTTLQKIRSTTNEMQWLTHFMILLEDRISFVGYKKGWWNE